jgi:hypothetical protein
MKGAHQQLPIPMIMLPTYLHRTRRPPAKALACLRWRAQGVFAAMAAATAVRRWRQLGCIHLKLLALKWLTIVALTSQALVRILHPSRYQQQVIMERMFGGRQEQAPAPLAMRFCSHRNPVHTLIYYNVCSR